MKSEQYYQQMTEAIEHTLLHLYFKAAASERHLTTEARNKIITDFIKPKIKSSRYSLCKKKLKTISLMKNKFGSIEKHLLSIHNDFSKVNSKNDVDKLYSLLEKLESAGFESKMIEETPNQEENVVYLDRAHIDHCFDDNNKQVDPISLFIHTQKLEGFLKCLNEQVLFDFESYQVNEELHNYHFQLHPFSRT
ncbi:DUF2913 family protein [Vibrio parahaemolyticus]|nr:DUF2913 family protein [Vibrio parahaemolyticus]EJR2787966.1 DUF2913 family protein [Vibrio parahaemolyticus]